MHTIQNIQSIISNTLTGLNLRGEPKELYEPIAYSMSMGGKRIRPLLTLLACDMFEGEINNAVYPAIAIELFHNFTLIHDDIMDKAPLRRGKETVYRKWNQDIAILSGDTLFAIAYQNLVKTKTEYIPEIINVFNQAAIEVCEGQQLDMNFEKLSNISIEDYINMIRLKTAALISASLKLGAIIGNADEMDVNNIYKFGENIGIAFQLMDDLLDVYSDSVKFGKTNSGDIKTNKKTYLYLIASKIADKEVQEKLKYYYSESFDNEAEKVSSVTEIFNNLDVKSHTIEKIDHYYEKAFNALEMIKAHNEKKVQLRKFTAELMNRQF